MTRLFLDEAGKLYAETWLVVQEIGLAFDLDSRKPGEEYGLVFEIQRHPLIADGDALQGWPRGAGILCSMRG